MTFFKDWELWEKMVFVLACLIVFVLIYGTGVQIRNRRRLKRLRREGGLQQSRPRNGNASDGHDIPFGSRALESGIEIEGIWISKPNTPVPSPHQAATPVGSRPASPARGLTSNSSPGIASVQPESSSQRPSSAKITQADNPQSLSSPSLAPSNGHSPAQDSPSMSEGYSRQIDSLGLERPKSALTKSHQGNFQPGENSSRTRTTASAEYPQAINPPGNDRRAGGSSDVAVPQTMGNRSSIDEDYGDLQALYSHRRSHAAEIGQLKSARNSFTKLADAGAVEAISQLLEDESGKLAGKA